MKKLLGLLCILAFSLQLIWPLIQSGYFPMHDDTQVGRVVAMGRALRWGQFPVRWVSDLGYGYGYPIFNFYGPLPYYIGGFFYALGFSGLIATKIMMGLGIMASGVTMFLLTTRIIGVFPAVTASVLYMYAPYHAVQLYVRGAVGELWTFVFLPLLAFGLMYPRRYVLLGGIGLAGVILSHTLLGYATVILLLIGIVLYWMFQRLGKKQSILFIPQWIGLVSIGLGVSAFFWLPAIFEMRFTGVAGQVSASADFHDHFVCLSQLWSSQWGFGGSARGCVDGMSFMLGKLHIVLGGIGILMWFTKSNQREHKKMICMGFLTTLLAVFLMMPWSRVIWETIPGFAYVQYPWRFLVFAVFGMSILGGMAMYSIPNKSMRFLVCIVVLGASVVLYGKRFTPQYLYERSAAAFETPQELRIRVSKISDEYLPADFMKPTDESAYVHDVIPSSESNNVRSIVETDTYARFAITTKVDNDVVVNRAYFPGLVILVNGKKQDLVVSNGLPTILIPKGENVIEIIFGNTPIRIVANIISVGVVFGLLFTYGKKVNA